MTQNQRKRIHFIIQQAVFKAGGNWRRYFGDYIDQIEAALKAPSEPLEPPSAPHTDAGTGHQL